MLLETEIEARRISGQGADAEIGESSWPKCSFAENKSRGGLEKMLAYISGKIDYFCSTKCEKNLLKLGRRPVDARWTLCFRAERKKRKGRK